MKTNLLIASVALLTLAGCLAISPLQPVKVQGVAMLPALKDGDRIIIHRRPDKLERGDIVLFLFPDDQRVSYIKRIVGLPNETVEIREGRVIINGQPLFEPYVDPDLDQSQRSLEPIKLAADSYYVLGDNRDNSSDSRFWGPLRKDLIYGKYLRKYFEAN